MALDHAQLAILKTEIDTDPNSLGYAGTSHPEAAALLNAISSANQIPNTSISISAVRDEIRVAEWEVISQAKRDMIMLIFGNGDIVDITNNLLVDQILDSFTVLEAPVTRAAMIALATRDGGRAEVLLVPGILITAADVMEARQL